MAFNHFFSATSLLVLGLLAVLVVTASASAGGYVTKPDNDKPKQEKQSPLSTIMGIQGLIYCKSGPKPIPLEGSVARITCEAVDEHGFEAKPVTILSYATAAKGYFFTTLSPSEIEVNKKLTQCKAFLEVSPLENCNVPTNVNNGTSGALLASYRLLHDKNIKLFTVGTFYFTSQPKPVNHGY